MLLAVDAGNSETTIGLYRKTELAHHWRLTSAHARTGDELAVLFQTLLATVEVRPPEITGFAVSSVVPDLTPAYRELGARLFGAEPLVIDHRTVPYLSVRVPDPSSVGSDRLVNAVAVTAGYGHPAVVVDLGTATTLDVVGADGAYLGGVIAPGIVTGAQALFQRGARLPRVEVRRPAQVVGTSTEGAMQSGIFFGAVGAVDALVRAVFREQRFPEGTPVVATGGLADAIREASETITAVDANLTLTGIRLVWERRDG